MNRRTWAYNYVWVRLILWEVNDGSCFSGGNKPDDRHWN